MPFASRYSCDCVGEVRKGREIAPERRAARCVAPVQALRAGTTAVSRRAAWAEGPSGRVRSRTQAKWQATQCPGVTSRSPGYSLRQRDGTAAFAGTKQRGWK